jgi:hypothetical protein
VIKRRLDAPLAQVVKEEKIKEVHAAEHDQHHADLPRQGFDAFARRFDIARQF